MRHGPQSVGWHHLFGWSKYGLRLPRAPLRCGLTRSGRISTIFHTPLTVPLHRQMPAVMALQGGCEQVYTERVESYKTVTILVLIISKTYAVYCPLIKSSAEELKDPQGYVNLRHDQTWLIILSGKLLTVRLLGFLFGLPKSLRDGVTLVSLVTTIKPGLHKSWVIKRNCLPLLSKPRPIISQRITRDLALINSLVPGAWCGSNFKVYFQ